tara:strand:- start:5781 stop:6386 length:606 start_codon:yes stop_codon:yes gene_type:complete
MSIAFLLMQAGAVSSSAVTYDYYYPLTNTSTDPTAATWAKPLDYSFVANDGIYANSVITNMDNMFLNSTSFNDADIITWDVSGVTSMASMFNGATSFNLNISTWVVTLVTSMNLMFNGATSFNQNLGGVTTSVSGSPFNFGINLDTPFDLIPSFQTTSSTTVGGWTTGLTSQPTNFSSGATSWTNSDHRPFLSDGTTRINT